MILLNRFRNKFGARTLFHSFTPTSKIVDEMDNIQVNCESPKHNGHNHLNGFSTSKIIEKETKNLGTEISIPVPWGHIAGKSYGDENNKPVLAVHGWMDNAGTFERLIKLLSKSLYIVAVDLPGHGKSSHLPPGVPYHFLDNIISLRRISDHFKWTKFSWLGHSMGAALGAVYASFYPDEIEKVVMLDLLMPLTRPTSEDFATRTAAAIDDFLAINAKINPNPPKYPYESALKRLMAATRVSRDGAISLMGRGAFQVGDDDNWSFSRDLRLRMPSLMRMTNEQCFEMLRKIQCALLGIRASGGFMDTNSVEYKEVMNIYQENCSQFTYIEVDGGHHVHLDIPERCAGHINNFFEQ